MRRSGRPRQPSQGRGRPRGFDPDKALEQAMRLFWRKGYEATSVSDLTGAMGINRPSLYAAFGNKESLFRRALDRYADGPSAYQREALQEPTAREVVTRILQGVIAMGTGPRNPPGCMWVHGVLSCGGQEDIREDLARRRDVDETNLRRRFQRALAERDLPTGSDPATLARYVGTLNLGLAVQAAAGASRAELTRVADAILAAWPPSPSD